MLTVRDKQTLDRIHRNYRMSYVKDVVLLRYFDDATLGSLNTLIFYNNMAIVQHFLENPQYLQQMISKMRTYVSPIPKPDKSTGINLVFQFARMPRLDLMKRAAAQKAKLTRKTPKRLMKQVGKMCMDL